MLLSIALAVFRFAFVDRSQIGLPSLIGHVQWLPHDPNAVPA